MLLASKLIGTAGNLSTTFNEQQEELKDMYGHSFMKRL
jgi:hypothetical protein